MSTLEERIQELEQELADLWKDIDRPKVSSHFSVYLSPSQWEGEMEDRKELHIRYIDGYLSVKIDGKEYYGKQIGDDESDFLDDFELIKQTKHVLDWGKQSWLTESDK